MFSEINNFIENRLNEFDQIPKDRKIILQKLADYCALQIQMKQPINLIYICTHNSRRSHFGQIAARVAASYFNIPDLHSYSGGTEATAFHANAINALKQIGFKISAEDSSSNPHYRVLFSDSEFTTCYSKKFDAPTNPSSNFAAVMTCSDADENCPFILGVSARISTTYDDPKISDGTGSELEVYTERFAQILRETLYAFSLVKT